MSKDDYEVIAYKILAYLYACLKAGKKVDIPAMRSLADCNEAYFGSVLKHLQTKGLVEGFVFDGLSGIVIDSPSLASVGEPAITMDGAIYVKENSRMEKVKLFLGESFGRALATLIESAITRM